MEICKLLKFSLKSHKLEKIIKHAKCLQIINSVKNYKESFSSDLKKKFLLFGKQNSLMIEHMNSGV